MIHTLKVTSQLSVLTSYAALATSSNSVKLANPVSQKIRTIELDGKTVKLQIVRSSIDSRLDGSIGRDVRRTVNAY